MDIIHGNNKNPIVVDSVNQINVLFLISLRYLHKGRINEMLIINMVIADSNLITRHDIITALTVTVICLQADNTPSVNMDKSESEKKDHVAK